MYGRSQAKLKKPWHGPNGPRPKQVPWWAPLCNSPASSASGSPRFKAHLHNLPYSDNSKPLNYSNNFLNHLMLGFTRIGEEERRDGEAIALHKTHIWANSLKPVCFLCFLLFWCPLLPVIETGTLKIYTKMVLYMKNEFFDLKYPLMGFEPTLYKP